MTYCETCGHYKVCKDKAEYWSNCPDYIEPVRHGKWLGNDDSWWCSECETENCFAYSEELKRFTDLYCPHCGARMDGD